MFRVSKRMEISAMHHLDLDYDSPCKRNHGHNWIITVEVCSPYVDESGMVIDFKRIKTLIHDKLDHRNLNEVFDFNPTAENIAWWVKEQVTGELSRENNVSCCSKVTVQESEGNIATWERD